MTACGPLCGPMTGGAASLPLPAGSGRCGPVVGGVAAQGFQPFLHGTEGRKKKQDKRRGRRWRLRPVTTARSAGSYGDFYVAVKWGQKQQTGITFAVTFPECLEAWTKTRVMPGIRTTFCCFATRFRQGLPLRNCGTETRIGHPDKGPSCYFSDNRCRVPWILDHHRGMLSR